MNSLFKVMSMQLNRKSRLGHSKTLFLFVFADLKHRCENH